MIYKNLRLSEFTIKALLGHPECFMASEYKQLREMWGQAQDERYQDTRTDNYLARVLR